MAQDASFQAFSRRSKEIGVRPGRFATLTLIGRNPGITQTALSRANSRDKSTLTPLRRRSRAPRADPAHARAGRPADLSAEPDRRPATKLLDQLTACAREHERELDAAIGARERAQFLRTLRKLAQEMG